MKIKKMSMSTKFLILSLVAIVLTMTLIGVSNIFAEPTIFDLVEAKDIGEFKPSNLYDPEKDEPKLYAWLNMNQIAVPHDMWYDYDEDGNVDVEDVYSVEGFEHNMYMNAQLYPIFQLDEDDEYVVVAMYDYKRYNCVPVEILIGYNSDMGHTFGKENYFFDSESKVLYIKKDLIEKEVEAVYLEVRFSNTPAQKLYEKYGFEKLGLRKKYYTNPSEDAVLMKKTIDLI